MTGLPFTDRIDGALALADAPAAYAGREDLLVLALPRGGVPVAAAVAKRLGAPLVLVIVRKLGAPVQKELAVGAIASGGGRVLNEDVARLLHLSEAAPERITDREREELRRRERAYRGQRYDFRREATLSLGPGERGPIDSLGRYDYFQVANDARSRPGRSDLRIRQRTAV
jgi:predicted phosphoribosyltransferase